MQRQGNVFGCRKTACAKMDGHEISPVGKEVDDALSGWSSGSLKRGNGHR